MPIGTAQPPAKRTVTAKPRSVPAPVPQSPAESRRQELEGLGKIGAMICIARGQYADAGAFHLHWPKLAEETAELAESNESVARIVDYICSAGPYAGILTAALTFGLQLAVNHGKIDPDKASGMGGIVNPQLLEERVKAEVEAAETAMKAEAEFFRAEGEKASQAVKEMRAEMNSR